MDEQKKCIKDAIDTIEPAADAKERMLANIKQKAALQSAQTFGEKPKRAKILSFNRVMKWALPVAACFVILLAGVLLAPQLLIQKNASMAPNASYDMPMEAEQGTSYMNESAYNGNRPADSARPSDLFEKSEDGEVGSYEFQFGSNNYSLRKLKQTENLEDFGGKQVASANENATLTVIEDGNTIRMEVAWSDGEYYYLLTNTDGATQEEIMEAYRSVK